MPRFKPIPESIWGRLAALERLCDVSMRREEEWQVAGARGPVWSVMGGPPSPRRRSWRVRVSLRGAPGYGQMVDASEPHLADALLVAVTEAERRGWSGPRAA